jgi:hypothetical protein
MPTFTSTPPGSGTGRSTLSEGWHPGFLLAITDEVTPRTWKMVEKSPRFWRWHFAVWEVPTLIGRQDPEHQSAPSSQTFSPGGQYQASKAYVWTCELLGRQVQPGESVDLDPLMPLPCRIKIRRNGEYANIVDLEKWPDGGPFLTPEIRAQLTAVMTTPPASDPPPLPETQQRWAQQTQAPQPGMQTWGQAPQAAPSAPTRPAW